MKTVKVWDLFVRFFHWSLVAAVVFQLATAEDFKNGHAKVGYFVIALLTLRIIWGVVGSRHARFADFIYPPAEILSYLKSLIQGRPKHYTGHNPAGGAMVCALLIMLLLTTLSGLLTYGAEGRGPLAGQNGQIVAGAWAHEARGGNENDPSGYGHGDDHARIHFWNEIHESLANIVVFLAILHFCGVIASSYIHRENLILTMFTGNKKIS